MRNYYADENKERKKKHTAKKVGVNKEHLTILIPYKCTSVFSQLYLRIQH